MSISQIFIMILGSSAIWMVGKTGNVRKWGFIVGLMGQPFWFYTAWEAQQYGIIAMCLFYTYSWGNGVYQNWIK